MKILNALLAALITAISIGPAGAEAVAVNQPPAAATAEEQAQVLRDFANSKYMKDNWLMMIEDIKVQGAKSVMEGATEVLEQSDEVTISEKSLIKDITIEQAPKISAEIADYFQKADAHKFLTELVTAVFPKYFSTEEIRDLNAFYESRLFQKQKKLMVDAKAESKRSGEDARAIFKRSLTQLTDEENKALSDFYLSSLGRKQYELAPQIKSDCQAFMQNYFTPEMTKIAEKYGKIIFENFEARKAH